MTIEDIPQLLAAIEQPDIFGGLERHGAIPVLVIDDADQVVVVFEKLSDSGLQNCSIILPPSS